MFDIGITEWVFLIILAMIVIGIYLLIRYIRNRAKDLSQQLFRTDSLIDGYQQQKVELGKTPKSISNMTRIYLPQIAADFPEFNYSEFVLKAENMLTSALNAISTNDIGKLQNASSELRSALEMQINANLAEGIKEQYHSIQIHETAITRYQKIEGTCVITLQSAVGHTYIKERAGVLLEGSLEWTEQVKYNIEIIYVQDTTKLASSEQTAFKKGTCPSCGAPLTRLGNKYCEYCGTAVETINIRVWQINKFKKD